MINVEPVLGGFINDHVSPSVNCVELSGFLALTTWPFEFWCYKKYDEVRVDSKECHW